MATTVFAEPVTKQIQLDTVMFWVLEMLHAEKGSDEQTSSAQNYLATTHT